MTNHTEQTAAETFALTAVDGTTYARFTNKDQALSALAYATCSYSDLSPPWLQNLGNGYRVHPDGTESPAPAFRATLTLPAAASSSTEPVATWQERQQTRDGWTSWYHTTYEAPGNVAFGKKLGGIEYEWRPLFARRAAPEAVPPASCAPAGFKLVPLEPTDEMEIAAENDYEQAHSHFPDWKRAYRAMVAAAPHTEEPAGGEAPSKIIASAEHCSAEVGRHDGKVVWVKFHSEASIEAFATRIVMLAALKSRTPPQAPACLLEVMRDE